MNLLYKTQETKEKPRETNAAVSLKNIEKNYSAGFRLKIDELTFSRGKVYAVMGPNGSGKTALLNIASSLEKPDKGQVESTREVGYVMQETFLFNRSVRANVAYGLKVRKFPKQETDKRVDAALDDMGIKHLKHRNPKDLSGGERKRVSIAQVMALDADTIFMDEPLANVDKATVTAIEKQIKNFKKEASKTIVITTHSLERAYRLSEDIITLKEGRISEITHENTFYGIIKKDGEETGTITISEGIDIALISKEAGQAYITIDPKSIILSKEYFTSSARNVFRGTITKAEETGSNIRVFIDCGAEFCAIITKSSYTRLNLNIGSSVYLNFKVNSVKRI